MRDVDVNKKVTEQFRRLLRSSPPWRSIVAIDPGNSMSGWAIAIDGVLESGEAPLEDAFDEVFDRLSAKSIRCVDVIVVEEPFSIGKGNQWKLARAQGQWLGALRSYRRHSGVWWEPKPPSWRSVLDLNVTEELDARGKARRDREAVTRAVHAFARGATGLSLLRSSGEPEADRCMALGMLYAARRILRSPTFAP